jgi:hypothetical protein
MLALLFFLIGLFFFLGGISGFLLIFVALISDEIVFEWGYLSVGIIATPLGLILMYYTTRTPQRFFKRIFGKFKHRKYLSSAQWKKLKYRKLRSVGWKCERCGYKGYKGQLHVHHKTYETKGSEDLNDLEVLCKRCHKAEHKL